MRAKGAAKGPAFQPWTKETRAIQFPFRFLAFYKTIPPPRPHQLWFLKGLRTLRDLAHNPDLWAAFLRPGGYAHVLYNRPAPAGFAKPTAYVRYFCSSFLSGFSKGVSKILLLS